MSVRAAAHAKGRPIRPACGFCTARRENKPPVVTKAPASARAGKGGVVTYTGKVTVGGPPDLRDLPGLSVAKLAVGPMDNNAYLLTCTVTGTAVTEQSAAGDGGVPHGDHERVDGVGGWPGGVEEQGCGAAGGQPPQADADKNRDREPRPAAAH